MEIFIEKKIKNRFEIIQILKTLKQPEFVMILPEPSEPVQPPEPNYQQSISVLLKENEVLEENRMCIECHKNPRDTAFLPCGHFTHCVECADQIDVCKIDNKEILGITRAFLG